MVQISMALVCWSTFNIDTNRQYPRLSRLRIHFSPSHVVAIISAAVDMINLKF